MSTAIHGITSILKSGQKCDLMRMDVSSRRVFHKLFMLLENDIDVGEGDSRVHNGVEIGEILFQFFSATILKMCI